GPRRRAGTAPGDHRTQRRAAPPAGAAAGCGGDGRGRGGGADWRLSVPPGGSRSASGQQVVVQGCDRDAHGQAPGPGEEQELTPPGPLEEPALVVGEAEG